MSQRVRIRTSILTVAAAAIVLPSTVFAQADIAPTNDLPNPFRTVEGWAKMPEGRTWGATSAVAIDPDGVSVWVAERCGANSCLDSNLDIILKFDANGNVVTSFAPGVAVFPHGFHIDHEGNIWLTDGRDNRPQVPIGQTPPPPPATLRGHQVMKFSPQGELLLTLGVPGGSREAGEFFWQPNAVQVAPNGDIFVSEGHSNNPQMAKARVLKFDRDGNFIKEFGTMGSGPGEFMQPHALAMDSQGRLFVGDRSNNRIQIFDQEGNFIDAWYQFSRPSGLFIDADDNLYVADSESGWVAPDRTDWKRGLRIGSARTGEVRYLIPDPATERPQYVTSSAEGVAVDRNGIIYGAEVGQMALKRYERQ
jgi:DNA-binding beta-propeller fold protein YncE